MTQYSLFGAEAATPSPDDLDGVLLAGGHWSRLGGTARLSVVVADRWRADSLAGVLAERGLCGEVVPAQSGWAVRTAFGASLAEPAAGWTRGAGEVPPPGLRLTAWGLRLWAVCAGRADDAGYVLGTAAPDDPVHTAAGAALSRLGLAAVSLGSRGAPGWRITSTKRLRRLAELVGAPPPGADGDWIPI